MTTLWTIMFVNTYTKQSNNKNLAQFLNKI